MPQHPLSSKMAWARLVLALVVIIAGVLTQFDVTVNQTVVRPRPLVKRNGTIPRADCLALGKRKGKSAREFIDTYGYPKGDDDGTDDLTYPLSEDKKLTCWLWFDNDKLDAVSVDVFREW